MNGSCVPDFRWIDTKTIKKVARREKKSLKGWNGSVNDLLAKEIFDKAQKKPLLEAVFAFYIKSLSGKLNIDRVKAFTSFLKVKSNVVIFANFINKTGDVYKIVLSCFCVFNKPVTFWVIKEFYCSLIHINYILKIYVKVNRTQRLYKFTLKKLKFAPTKGVWAVV